MIRSGTLLRVALGMLVATAWGGWPARGLAPLARAAPAASGAERLPTLELHIDPAEVDLAGGQLTARLSRPAAKLTLKVVALGGGVLEEVERTFETAAAGTPLVLSWKPSADVARLEVFGYDTSGYYKGIAITPWSFQIPHEDVRFATDSAQIEPAEEKKLTASLALIKKELPRAAHLGAVSLFVLAHTDSVGTAEHNVRLSTRRAESIGRWFRGHGLRIPMAYDGVGEGMLKIPTPDEVDEPRNRRVDYMLSIEAPRFAKSRTTPAWKKL